MKIFIVIWLAVSTFFNSSNNFTCPSYGTCQGLTSFCSYTYNIETKVFTNEQEVLQAIKDKSPKAIYFWDGKTLKELKVIEDKQYHLENLETSCVNVTNGDFITNITAVNMNPSVHDGKGE